MTDKVLTVTFSNQSRGENSYWLRMELFEDDSSTMTVGEAADFIDALYNTDVCAGENDDEPRPEPTAVNWANGFSAVDLPQCNYIDNAEDPGSYDVAIKVYRSHQEERYKLLFSNGYASGPMRVEEKVVLTLAVDDVAYLLLDTPVVRDFRAAWTDISGPTIHVAGNLLYWASPVTGTIRAEFTTVYDVWQVHVTGIYDSEQSPADGSEVSPEWLGTGWYSGDEDGTELTDVQNTECTVLAFYHYQYEMLVLDKPERDDSVSEADAAAICYNAGATDILDAAEECNRIEDADERAACLDRLKERPDDWYIAACKESCADRYDGEQLAACIDNCEPDCFTRKKYETVCSCGGERNTEIISEKIPCPGGYNTGSNVGETTDGGLKYVDCGADEVNQESYYEQKCCVPWPFDEFQLPYCKELYEPYIGKSLSNDDRELIKQQYGPDVNIIMVGPSGPVCGEQVTTQDVPTTDCCGGVPPLMWDYENSGDTVAPGGSVTIVFTGGLFPVTVQLSGSGFWLDSGHSIKTALINDHAFAVYADSGACGSCRVELSDGCSRLEEYVRSTEGKWDNPVDGCADGCGVVIQDAGGSEENGTYTRGRFRWYQHRVRYNSSNWSVDKPPCAGVTTNVCGSALLPDTREWCEPFEGVSCSGSSAPAIFFHPYKSASYPFLWGGVVLCHSSTTKMEWMC